MQSARQPQHADSHRPDDGQTYDQDFHLAENEWSDLRGQAVVTTAADDDSACFASTSLRKLNEEKGRPSLRVYAINSRKKT